MTINEFADISCVTEETIRRNLIRIKGVSCDMEGNIVIPDGSRYPYNPRRNKLDTQGKQRIALLDATYHNRYIDDEILKMSKKSFCSMIEELLSNGYLRSNGTNNPYGANSFSTTQKYENMLECKFEKRMKIIGDVVSTTVVSAVGMVVKEVLT